MGRGERGSVVYLSRERATQKLVALKLRPNGSDFELSVLRELDAVLPVTPNKCPVVRRRPRWGRTILQQLRQGSVRQPTGHGISRAGARGRAARRRGRVRGARRNGALGGRRPRVFRAHAEQWATGCAESRARAGERRQRVVFARRDACHQAAGRIARGDLCHADFGDAGRERAGVARRGAVVPLAATHGEKCDAAERDGPRRSGRR